MASASKTPNLNLPQWVGTEKPERTDLNAAFDAIDTTVASHLAESVSLGNTPHGIVYETGIWTPTLTFGDASVGITYVQRSGMYVRNGNSISCGFVIELLDKGTSTGVAKITGLPFVESLYAGITLGETYEMTLPSGARDLYALVALSGLLLRTNTTSGVGVVSVTNANFNDGTRIRGYFTYIAQ